MLTSNNQCSIYFFTVACVWPHATGVANTAHNWAEANSLPTTGVKCHWLNNWTSHWCKVLSFHWTTLMQDTLDITGAGYEYDFIWLYTGCSILVQWKDTTQVCSSGVTGGVQGREPPPWQAKCKNWAPILLIFQYSVLFWFSISYCFLRFSDVFGQFSGAFGF